MSKTFTEGEIEGVVVRDLKRFSDARGWLSELFRSDEISGSFYPEMAYLSMTEPGVTRGPHEHVHQADYFCFLGPSNFKLRMWDTRRESSTFGVMSTLIVGIDNPKSVLIPKGIVHGYQNVGTVSGMVINCPDQLYMGQHKTQPVDEIRHEDDPNTIFRMG
ncbi:MAG: dTDP-4-dehydrorhamnose 3,5-epimerase [Blastocatellia bacterium]|nr:MAG: dTDP-4-dehydrorhamnose 3,5-epimerase [Blastocatellia bacterium]